jgi:hypothetical protein
VKQHIVTDGDEYDELAVMRPMEAGEVSAPLPQQIGD